LSSETRPSVEPTDPSLDLPHLRQLGKGHALKEMCEFAPQSCPGLMKRAFAATHAIPVFQNTLPEGHLALKTLHNHQ